jgi:hypothetical protein
VQVVAIEPLRSARRWHSEPTGDPARQVHARCTENGARATTISTAARQSRAVPTASKKSATERRSRSYRSMPFNESSASGYGNPVGPV